jgi:hypothetical protein
MKDEKEIKKLLKSYIEENNKLWKKIEKTSANNILPDDGVEEEYDQNSLIIDVLKFVLE